MDGLIEKILTTKRAHNSIGELNFLKWLHDYIKEIGHDPVPMAEGCIAVECGASKVMFSCHVDTVHPPGSCSGDMQNLYFDQGFGHIFLAGPQKDCLGADDGAGVYVLLSMLKAKVPGTYVFHRGEERGGIGSNAMLRKHKDWLSKFNQCVAFDRAGGEDIVITQGGKVCGSPAYANSLAALLKPFDLDYKISHLGSFTDSKVYRQIIPECINLSVGYEQQHGPSEYLDFEHLVKLTNAAIAIDWASLTIARKPEPEPEPEPYSPNSFERYTQARSRSFSEFTASRSFPNLLGEAEISLVRLKTKASTKKPIPTKALMKSPFKPQVGKKEDLEFMNYEEICEWANDETLADAISTLLLKNGELEARAAVYRQLLGL